MPKRLLYSLTTVVLLIMSCVGAFAEEKKADDGWLRLENKNIIFEYEARDSEIAQKIWPELVKQVESLHVEIAEMRSDRERLKISNDKALQFIASAVGEKKPSDNMRKAYDAFAFQTRDLISGIFLNVWQFRLLHKEEIKERLRKGEKVDWFRYDPATDSAYYDFNFGANVKTPDTPMPVLLGVDGASAEDIVKDCSLIGLLPDAIKNFFSSPVVVYHEVAETAIVHDQKVNSGFRRWFCDGTAQVIAELCTKRLCGEQDYQTALRLLGDSSSNEPFRDKVDLLSWRAAEFENTTTTKMDDDLEHAHYFYATKEMRGLVERHGEDVLPKIIKEIVKLGPSKDQSIYDAIKNVTGEDMKARLSAYGSANDDPFRGISAFSFKVGYAEVDPSTDKPGEITETTTIPLQADGKHRVILKYYAYLLDPPAQTTMQLIDRDGNTESTMVFPLKAKEHTITFKIDPLKAKLKLGDYKFRILFNDKLYKEIPIKIVEPGTIIEGRETSTNQP